MVGIGQPSFLTGDVYRYRDLDPDHPAPGLPAAGPAAAATRPPNRFLSRISREQFPRIF